MYTRGYIHKKAYMHQHTCCKFSLCKQHKQKEEKKLDDFLMKKNSTQVFLKVEKIQFCAFKKKISSSSIQAYTHNITQKRKKMNFLEEWGEGKMGKLI